MSDMNKMIAYMCVCVWKRERERERERDKQTLPGHHSQNAWGQSWV